MPDGAHTWPGVHSYPFLKKSVDLNLDVASLPTVKATVRLKPENVGHSVPSAVVRKSIQEVKLYNSEGPFIKRKSNNA